MDRSLYIAMSGAKQTLLAQAANAHNLANANTTGFKADFNQFRSMPVFGPGQPSRVYAMTERPGIDFNAGALQQTGRDLDVAVHGEGWIAVQADDGSEAYIRSSEMRVTPEGLMLTGNGLPVLGGGGPVALPPYEKLEIGNDGTISLIPLGDPASTLAAVDQIKLVNPPVEDLVKGKDGLFRVQNGAPAEPDATVSIVAGALEASNVSTVDALVNMIELARQFELQVKVMKTVADNEAASASIMSMT